MVKLTTLQEDLCKERIRWLEFISFRSADQLTIQFFLDFKFPLQFIDIKYIHSHLLSLIWIIQSLGFRPATKDDKELVVNTRKELCGGFINLVNVTMLNYTSISPVKNKKRRRRKKKKKNEEKITFKKISEEDFRKSIIQDEQRVEMSKGVFRYL